MTTRPYTPATVAAADPVVGYDVDSYECVVEWDDGSYWTGIAYPSGATFPDRETSAYTAAAVILADDAITGATPAGRIFAAHHPR